MEAPDEAPTEGGKRRFYALTGAGREVLAEEVHRLAGFVRLAADRGVAPGLGGA